MRRARSPCTASTSTAVMRPAADFDEVVRIGRGLDLQDAVDGADERDQVVHRRIARLRRELRVLAHPFHLVQDRVLRFLLRSGTGTRPSTAGTDRRPGRCSRDSAPARTARCGRSARAPPRSTCASTADATSFGCGRKRVARRACLRRIIVSMRRNSSWCLSSSSVKRTSASQRVLVAQRSARGSPRAPWRR